MTRSRAALVEAIAERMQDLSRLRAGRPEPWLHLELTLPQLKVLLFLGAGGPGRQSAIAAAIGVTATGLTGLIDRLEDRALVRRQTDPDDRRATMVHLESAGRALVDNIYSAGRGKLVEVLGRMDVEDLRALEQGITALVVEQAAVDAALATDAQTAAMDPARG